MNIMKLAKGVMNKKGNFGIMTQAAIAIGVFFFVIAIVVLLLAKVGENSTVSADGNATAAVNEGKEALNNMSDLGGILVYVLFLVIVLGMFTLVGYGIYKATR